MSHVAAFNCTNYFAILLDLTPGKVLFPEIICAVLRGSYEIVCFVGEGDCASDLMQDRSHEHTAQIVIGLIAADFASILKGNFFKAIAHHIR